MKFSKSELTIIKKVILTHIEDAKIFLFGSKVYDNKKGGDIDIFVQINKNITLKTQLQILTEIKLEGVLRKVDLVIQTPYSKKSAYI